ncbi:hypothetical protein DW260_04455 [Clostridium sp. AM22-16AC]|nr:hypothetical protein DW260_04455 [Clostridium sp. AM22-16AC]
MISVFSVFLYCKYFILFKYIILIIFYFLIIHFSINIFCDTLISVKVLNHQIWHQPEQRTEFGVRSAEQSGIRRLYFRST